MDKDFDQLKDTILSVVETSLAAQLKAVRKLRQPKSTAKLVSKRSMSQIDMVHDILRREQRPLHIKDIITRVQAQFGIQIDRESIVSALTKKVQRHDRFSRVGKNTFALSRDLRDPEGSPGESQAPE